MSNENAYATAATKAKSRQPLEHVHGLPCTYEVCGVGPRRADLIRASLERRGIRA